MKKSLLIALYLSFGTMGLTQTITPGEAKNLTSALTNLKTDTSQIRVLLQLAKYHIFKPGEEKNDLDSAANFLKRAENINAEVQSNWAKGYILLIESYLTREKGDREKAKETVRQAVDILKDEKDKLLAGEAYFDYSGYYDIGDTKQLEERIKLVQAAVACFEQAKNLERVGASLHMLGDLHQINGSDFIALEKLQQALDVYASIHHDAVQGIYSMMGRIYIRQRDYKKALEYGLLALKTAEKVGDNSIQMCMVNNDVANTFFILGEREKSLSHYKAAFDIAKKHNDINAIFITATYVASALNSVNRPKEGLKILDEVAKRYERPKSMGIALNTAVAYINCYIAVKQFQKAEPYTKQLLDAVNTTKMNAYSSMIIYAEVIKFYVYSGQFDQAAKYLDKHKELADQTGDKLHMANNHKLQFMLDTSMHNYRSAIDHAVAFKRLSDSLYNETSSQQTAKLQVQYETEKKEQDILIKDKNIQLLNRQSQLQQAQNERDRFAKNALLAGAGLLLLILILVFNGYRLKRKSNRQLQQQQLKINQQNHSLQELVSQQGKLIGEKEWLIREIHHRVKNNLQIVMSLLNSQSAYIDNEPALAAIHDSQHRVHAMSLIHQKLYGSENLSSIDMSVYIRELVSYLAESFNTGRRIQFELNIEPMEMDVSQAVPLGLILNEAITNSIKYAFPDGRNGIVTVALSSVAFHQYMLSISDNGIGLPVHFIKKKKPGSLGMSLIEGLSEDLDGNMSIENNNGTLIRVSFVGEAGFEKPDKFASSFAPGM